MNAPPPGFLSDQVNPEVVLMMCTAGHVDHGKTLLVKLLTGCQTDRLKEEQERGLTIELGYAPCYLQNNLCIGIVDVPGHERLVKTMVAGVSGIAMSLLVVAADDGIMPQTVEHVQIMDLLGVRQGLVALTKIDSVSAERVQECAAEIRDFLKDTFLAGAPICPVSSRTFEGYEAFYETLVAEIRRVIHPPRRGLFRMPLERIFTLPGQGTVVSGIPVDGEIGVGELVEVVPGSQTGRIRGMQRFGRDAVRGGYGQCLALNVPDFDKEKLARGQVMGPPGYLQAADCFHVSLKVVPDLKKPLGNGEEIKFHTGTIEATGRLHLLEAGELQPGQSGLATFTLIHPVAAAVHDRFILRRPSPPITVAGGEIRAITWAARRPRRTQLLPQLQAQAAFFADADWNSPEGLDKRTEWYLRCEGKLGAAQTEISRGTLLPMSEVSRSLARLVASGKVLALSEDYHIQTEAYCACRREVETRIQLACREDKALSLTLGDLRRHCPWPPPLWKRLEQDLAQRRQIRRQGDKVILAGAVEQLAAEDRDLLAQLVRVYEETGFHSPRPEELGELVKAEPARINRLLDHLYNEQKLIRLSPHVVLSYAYFRKAQDWVVQMISEQGVLNSAEFKYRLDSTRKYALAILDFLDARRVTVRLGNDRKLTVDYQRNLL